MFILDLETSKSLWWKSGLRTAFRIWLVKSNIKKRVYFPRRTRFFFVNSINKSLYLKGFCCQKQKKRTNNSNELLPLHSFVEPCSFPLATLQLEPTKVENILPTNSHKSRRPQKIWKKLNNQTIAQTTAAATTKTIAYSRSGTRRPIDAPHAAQNFGW